MHGCIICTVSLDLMVFPTEPFILSKARKVPYFPLVQLVILPLATSRQLTLILAFCSHWSFLVDIFRI